MKHTTSNIRTVVEVGNFGERKIMKSIEREMRNIHTK
jgi:hypothetical protein